MKNSLLTAALSAGLLCGTTAPAFAGHHYRTPAQQVEHKRHMKTAKRVGVGAVGGALVGSLVGHGAGAAVGAAAGAGAGYAYDKHKKHHGHY